MRGSAVEGTPESLLQFLPFNIPFEDSDALRVPPFDKNGAVVEVEGYEAVLFD